VVKGGLVPAPRKFSQAELQRAALALVDAEGLGALTMRSLAAALGTGAMTIYNYVEGREGLEALLVEAVLAEAEPVGVPSADWRSDLRTIAEANWRAIRAHSAVIPLILTRRGTDPATLRIGEATLDALARSGRTGTELLAAFRTVTAFVNGFAQVEIGSPVPSAGTDDVVCQVLRLPAERYPRLVQAATTAAGSDPVTEFRAGLDLLIAGLDR
jgi:AcrR family transcriptional regulator